jgi:predicted methyltransferase
MFRKIVAAKPARFSKPGRFSSEIIYLNVYRTKKSPNSIVYYLGFYVKVLGDFQK